MPSARAIRQDSNRDPASLLPTHFVLFASIPIAFPTQQQHPPTGGQAAHANAKTKAYPNVSSRILAGEYRCLPMLRSGQASPV